MKQRHQALIVDDEPDIRELLEITLQRMGIDTLSAANLNDARLSLGHNHIDLCLADLRLPDGNGLDLVRQISQEHPQIPVSVITAHGNMETVIEALRAGAFDFIPKPIDLGALRKLVQSALKINQAQPVDVKTMASRPKLLGNSQIMQDLRALIAKVARSQAPVYIGGESGTGKELAARAIHAESPRANQAFVAVNCGAIPSELMESELFGHLKGSFTGAIRDHKGLFQAAEGGTLFLDEVGDLPQFMQVKLLRAIQEKAVRPVGSAQEINVDVRIISATHQNLQELQAAGVLRQDLYYRLNVIALQMPTLRARNEDIELLANHFLDQIAQNSQQPRPQLSKQALNSLKKHTFPGNVRELENAIERAFALCENALITPADLALDKAPAHESPESLPADASLEDYLAGIEKNLIQTALDAERWNRTNAAKRLGLTLRALRYRMEKLGLEDKP